MSRLLEGKVALVTGGAGGIGRAVARAVVAALRSGAPEVLVPAAGGIAARIAAAFPRLLLWLLPFLRRSGARRMARLRAGRLPPAG